MKSNMITYKGKNIFYADYSNLSPEQIREEVNDIEKVLVEHAQEGSGLILVNITGTIISPDVLNMFKNISLKSRDYVQKTAILGITGARRVFMELVTKFSGANVMPFDDMQKAKDWLVSD